MFFLLMFGSELACVHSSIQSSAATLLLSVSFNCVFLRLSMKSSFLSPSFFHELEMANYDFIIWLLCFSSQLLNSNLVSQGSSWLSLLSPRPLQSWPLWWAQGSAWSASELASQLFGFKPWAIEWAFVYIINWGNMFFSHAACIAGCNSVGLSKRPSGLDPIFNSAQLDLRQDLGK